MIIKINLISTLMASLGKKTIAVHILPNISRSKGNQTIKFDQSIEYSTRKESNTKCGGAAIPRPFSKKSKLSISLSQ